MAFWNQLRHHQKALLQTVTCKRSWKVKNTWIFEPSFQFWICVFYKLVLISYTKLKKNRNFWHSYQIYRKIRSRKHSSDGRSHFVNVILFLVPHVTLKMIFRKSYSAFSKSSSSLTHCRMTMYSLSIAQFFQLSSKLYTVVNPKCLDSIHFCMVKKERTVSLEFIVSIRYGSLDERVKSLHRR